MIFGSLRSSFRELSKDHLDVKFRLRLVLSISIRMAEATIGSELMIVDEGCSLDGCENSKREKCIDSTYHEKTSYADILGGKNVLGDDYVLTVVGILLRPCFLILWKIMRKMLKIVWKRML